MFGLGKIGTLGLLDYFGGAHSSSGPVGVGSGLLLEGDMADDATDFLLLEGDMADDVMDFLLLEGDMA